MFWVYAIKSELGKIYIGQTSDLQKRLARHNRILPSRKMSYTYKNGQFWSLLHKEEFSSREEAIKRKKQLKSYQGRLFLKNLLK